jgi:antitoxin ParD1/3/4
LRNAIGAGQREHAERLTAIRARIRRSLDDPRPAVPIDEAFDRIEKLHADTVKSRKRIRNSHR